jgi:hypothetical protein
LAVILSWLPKILPLWLFFLRWTRSCFLCGITDAAARACLILAEGLDSLDEFGDATNDEIADMAKRNESRTTAAARVQLGMTRIKRLKAVAFWVRKQRREGVPVDVGNLTAAVINQMIAEKTLAPSAGKKDEKLFESEKFDPKHYKKWSRLMGNHLETIKGQTGIPLSYLIWSGEVDPLTADTAYLRSIWLAPLVGEAYDKDNCQVHRIYKNAILGTEGWVWFNQTLVGDGRAAHIFLTNHYLGTAEAGRRAAEAEAQLARLHYKNKASFPFEKYITRLYECFEALDDNEQGYRDAHKVKQMLENVTSSNVEVIAFKTVIRNNYPNDFAQASTHMAAKIALIFLAAQSNIRNKRRIGAMDSRGGGRGGQGRGRRTTMLNGVDVSDPPHSFSPDEWAKLVEGHHVAQIHEMRGRGRGRGRGGRGGNRDGGRGCGGCEGRQGRNI